MKKTMLILAALVLIAGCSKKITKPDAKPQTAPTEAPVAAKVEKEPAENIMEKLTETALSDIKQAEGPESLGVEKSIVFKDVFFDYDSYEINNKSVADLGALSSWLVKNAAKVLIEGHCDERGTTEYNLALGDRRASTIQQYLISSGVPLWRIQTVSYGEGRPQCSDQNEECFTLNRRAHPVILGNNGNDGEKVN